MSKKRRNTCGAHNAGRPHQNVFSKFGAIALTAALLYSANAYAENPSSSMFSFSGFGTLGLTHSSEDDAEFVAHKLQPSGAGHSRNWSADVDSRIGGQITANFTPQLSAIVQVVAEHRYDGTYRPDLEWANIRYEVTPDFSIRAGRIVLGSFLASDYRKVGYAQPWVRPPFEVYSLIPLTSSDGVDLSYRLHMGKLTNTVQAAYGETSARIPAGGKATSKDTFQISDTVEYGPATLRVTYGRSKLTIDAYKPLFGAYRNFAQTAAMFGHAQAAAQANAIADKYEPDDKPFRFLGIGASYDPGDWFVMAEWGQTDSDSSFGKRAGWYASAGYRWGKFTPYVSYAKATLHSNSSDPGITAAPPPFHADATALNSALNADLALAPIQQTVSLGVRWDFARNAALKVQYDHSNLAKGSPGSLTAYQPGFTPGGTFSVFSATVDFLF